MVHSATTIELAEGRYLQIGYVMCFTEPSVTMTRVEKKAGQPLRVEGELSFDPAHVDAVIAALQRVREALPKKE
jgi:hypothetical protein